MNDVVRTCVFSSSFIDTVFLLYDIKPCTYDVIYMMRLLLQNLSPIFSCVVSFLS